MWYGRGCHVGIFDTEENYEEIVRINKLSPKRLDRSIVPINEEFKGREGLTFIDSNLKMTIEKASNSYVVLELKLNDFVSWLNVKETKIKDYVK